MDSFMNELSSSRYQLIRACEDSLRRLNTDHIDIYSRIKCMIKYSATEQYKSLSPLYIL